MSRLRDWSGPRGAAGVLAVLLALLSGCAVGPRYTRPTAPVPSGYKEAGDWKIAQPTDQAVRGDWWKVFGDPELDALEGRIDVSNQDLAVADARFRSARAAVRGARAALFPVLGASASVVRSHPSGRRPQATAGTTGFTTTDYQLPVDLSYEADVWDRVRRDVEASVASAQAAQADLETVRLTLHAELALDYFELHGVDAERQLLDTAVAAYEKALALTINRYDQGVVSGVDVAQARTQLETTRAQATDVGISRAQLEHAIAILVGEPPAEFGIEPAPIAVVPPQLPVELPSDLLERRPDVAAAERRVAAANAQVGVATAAFFPHLAFSASAGWESGTLARWISAPAAFWSLGASLAQTIFEGGQRRAAKEGARASYDAAVAAYRETVLGALQEVEDSLAALRDLGQEAREQAGAVEAAERALALARNRYEGGITTYLEVVTAQSAALADERTAADIRTRQMTASVNLVKALGGGWRAPEPARAGEVGAAHALASP